jgi:hypothetical protein
MQQSAIVAKKIGNRSIISVDGGQWGACASFILSWVTVWGTRSGKHGGGGWIGHGQFFAFFWMSPLFFGGERRAGGGKIRLDLKKVNASWSL